MIKFIKTLKEVCKHWNELKKLEEYPTKTAILEHLDGRFTSVACERFVKSIKFDKILFGSFKGNEIPDPPKIKIFTLQHATNNCALYRETSQVHEVDLND